MSDDDDVAIPASDAELDQEAGQITPGDQPQRKLRPRKKKIGAAEDRPPITKGAAMDNLRPKKDRQGCSLLCNPSG